MHYGYSLEARINRGDGPEWERIAAADSISELKRDANNWTLEYRVIDHRRDRANTLDVGPRHCRLTRWVAL